MSSKYGREVFVCLYEMMFLVLLSQCKHNNINAVLYEVINVAVRKDIVDMYLLYVTYI